MYANATMENTKVISGDGVDEITLYKGSHTKDNTFETGSGNDTINLNESTSGNIMRMGTGEDHVNITNGITVKDTEIYGDLYDEGGNGWQDVTGSTDHIKVGENVTLENVKIYGDALYDQYKTDPTYFSQEERKAISGDDEISIADNATLKDVEIYGDSDYEKGDFSQVTMEGGNDTITIGNNAKLDNVKINGEVGDDVISIGKNAHIQNTFEINGGTGFDTLKVADNSIDFSQVSNIEKLDTTNGEKTQLTLSADDIQNILRDSDKDKLKLDGDSNDEITLTGGNWIKGASNDGYTSYSDGTTTIEIKDEVQNVIY